MLNIGYEFATLSLYSINVAGVVPFEFIRTPALNSDRARSHIALNFEGNGVLTRASG